jgi:hypothetical protein
MICASMVTFEPQEAMRTFEDIYSSASRKMYVVGPLKSTSTRATRIEMDQAAKSPEIIAFMNQTLQLYGQNTLIYVSKRLVHCSSPDFIISYIDIFWHYLLAG